MPSAQLAQVVGTQQPGEHLEKSDYFSWGTTWLRLDELLHATQDGDIPEGGWAAAYERHLEDDKQAVDNGSPEYAGRDAWLRCAWLPDSRIYPLYLVHEPAVGVLDKPRLRLLDGHRRLAGAFYYNFPGLIFALVGTPLMQAPQA